jgi:Ca2+/Na+ antiporter
MSSRKRRLIYILLAVMVLSNMMVTVLSGEEWLHWLFWTLVPILFIIVPMFVLYQINAEVRYLEEWGKPKPRLSEVKTEMQEVYTLTGPITKTKRLQIKTSWTCPAYGQPISIWRFQLSNFFDLRWVRCQACKTKSQICIRPKQTVIFLVPIIVASVLWTYIGDHLDPSNWVIGVVFSILGLTVILVSLSDYCSYLRDMDKPKKPPSRNQPS